jgi:stage II sporulation protein AB (anti-sigma F factor)
LEKGRKGFVGKVIENKVRVEMDACSRNERFARLVAAGFLMDFDPTLMEMEDVKTAVSEAVTNAVIHGYGKMEEIREETEGERNLKAEEMAEAGENVKLEEVGISGKAEDIEECGKNTGEQKVVMSLYRKDRELTVVVEDYGRGMEDVHKAMEPMYTSCPQQERSGMGFTFMEEFMDSLAVESVLGEGTKVTMKKVICSE